MKKLLKVLPVVLVLALCFTSVFAGSGVSTSFPQGGSAIGNISSAADTVWGTVLKVVQICAFAGIVLAGVNYMLADSKKRADIKDQTIVLVFGAILVFASPAIVNFVKGIAESIFQ